MKSLHRCLAPASKGGIIRFFVDCSWTAVVPSGFLPVPSKRPHRRSQQAIARIPRSARSSMSGRECEGKMDDRLTLVPLRKRCVYMTYNETRKMAIPHQDNRILSSLECLSRPYRPMTPNRERWGGVVLRRIRHGIARTAENLRKLWLPLVSGANSRERLLQGV